MVVEGPSVWFQIVVVFKDQKVASAGLTAQKAVTAGLIVFFVVQKEASGESQSTWR